MKRDCSASRPNSVAAVGVQFEGNSPEEAADVLWVGAVKGGSRNVVNIACELCEDCFLDDSHRNAAIQTSEPRRTLSHAHEKHLRVCKRAR